MKKRARDDEEEKSEQDKKERLGEEQDHDDYSDYCSTDTVAVIGSSPSTIARDNEYKIQIVDLKFGEESKNKAGKDGRYWGVKHSPGRKYIPFIVPEYVEYPYKEADNRIGIYQVYFKARSPDRHSLPSPLIGARFANHFKDGEYIELFHRVVVGKMLYYRMAVTDLSGNVRLTGHMYHAVEAQDRWAKEELSPVIEAISKFKMFPVIILNDQALMQFLPEIKSFEMADFVRRISNCYTVDLIGYWSSEYSQKYEMLTRWNGKDLIVYGSN